MGIFGINQQQGNDVRGMVLPTNFISRRRVAQLTAASITLLSCGLGWYSVAIATPPPINSVNNGPVVQGGTYLNTPGNRTTFTNNANGGLWLHSGDAVHGLENHASGTPTNQCGTLQFHAPGNVVHIDGNIDVNAVRNGTQYTGNGGKVFVDSTHLSNNGNIFANSQALSNGSGAIQIAAAPPINSVNDGRIVQGGTYLNTADSKTTFINSHNGGLWVQTNTTVRGLESDATGKLTNHGGTFQFYAPDNVVRIDGTVNVNGLLNGSGAFIGNGGKVFVDSAYLINNGNIFASGINGGLVQLNVGGLAMNSTGRIFAHGFGGNGGVISVNSSGPVDIRRGAVIDSAGKVAGTLDTNIINLEGSIVNVDGVLRADGVSASNVSSRGGTIRLVATGRTDMNALQNAFIAAGKTNPGDASATPTLSAAEQNAIVIRSNTLVNTEEGSVNVGYRAVDVQGKPTGGWLSVNGSNGPAANNNDLTEDTTERAGDGGTIIMAADQNVRVRGMASANGGIGADGSTLNFTLTPNLGVNGGNGGTITLTGNRDIAILNTTGQLSGAVQANGGMGGQTGVFHGKDLQTTPSGRGGNGGLIAFSYLGAMGNRGNISTQAGQGGLGSKLIFFNGGLINQPALASVGAGIGGNGGQGGLLVFSGNANPLGSGSINDSGGQGGAGLTGHSQGGSAGLIVAPDPNTLRNTQLVIQQDGAAGNASSNAGTVRIPLGQTHGDELLTHAENLIWLRKNEGSNNNHPSDISGILFSNQGIARSVTDLNGQGTALNLILAKSPNSTYPYRNFTVGSSANNLLLSLARPFPEQWNGLSNLSNLTITNNGKVTFPAPPDFWQVRAWGGGHLSVLAIGNIGNNEDGYAARGTVVGGTINLASRKNIVAYSLITTSALTSPGQTAYHDGSIMMKADGDLQNLSFLGGASSNPLMGESIRLKAGHDFINLGTVNANAGGNNATGARQAGLVTISAGNELRIGNQGIGGPSMVANSTGTSAWGGYIHLKALTITTPSLDYLQANGLTQNGRIVTEGAIQLDPPF